MPGYLISTPALHFLSYGVQLASAPFISFCAPPSIPSVGAFIAWLYSMMQQEQFSCKALLEV